MKSRKDALLEIVTLTGSDNNIKAMQLIDEIVFIEEQLRELKKLPFISVHPKNPALQKATPASKQYKEMMQQYNNSLRLLFRLTGDLNGESEEDSPLRQWVKSRKEK
jgi:hypothetical protein